MTKPYTIFRARDEYEIYGVVSIPDADHHCIDIYDDDDTSDHPIIILPYSGEFNVHN